MILERQEKHLAALAELRYRTGEIARVLFTQPPQPVDKSGNEAGNQMINVQNNLDSEDRLLEEISNRLHSIEEVLGLVPAAVGGQLMGTATSSRIR